MGQALKDVPRNRAEYERQKGPMPPSAVLLLIGLFCVFLFFFGPPLLATITEAFRGE